MSHNIDSLFKKKLQDTVSEPPAYIWEHIHEHLIYRRKLIITRWVRSIAAVALLSALVWLYQLRSGKIERIPVANIITVDSQKNVFSAVSLLQSESPILSVHPVPLTKTSVPVSEFFSDEAKRQEKPVSLEKNLICSLAETLPDTHLKESPKNRDYIPLVSKEALRNNEEYTFLLQQKNHSAEVVKHKISFTLSGHFIPAYSSGSYTSSAVNARGRSYSRNQLDGMINAGGGLRLTLNTGKRFSVQTGLYYSRMGQQSSEQNTSTPTHMMFQKNSQNIVSTPLGNIKNRKMAIAYRKPGNVILTSVSNDKENLEQVFGALEIPLYLRYKLNNNKITFTVSGGFSGNFIVNNKVYLEENNDKNLIGSTEDIRTFNMSTGLSVGMEYPVTQKIKILIEPGVKYYLQSLSQNENIDFKPYIFSLSTGIGFDF